MYLYTNVLKDVGVMGVFHFWASLEMCFVGQMNGEISTFPTSTFSSRFQIQQVSR